MYRQFSRLSVPVLVGFAIAALAGCWSLRPDRALAVAPNLVSHQLCSAVFVAGLEPDSYYREALAPRAFSSEVDTGSRQENASK
jgi:hypothetical protein